MVLIITTTSDISAHEVGDWINKMNGKVQFITDETIVKLVKYDLNKGVFTLEIDGKEVASSEIDSVWYRTNKLKFQFDYISIEDKEVEKVVNLYLNYEMEVLEEMINEEFVNNFITVNNNDNIYINKLIQLKYANKVGLKIPQTNIYNSKDEIIKDSSNTKKVTKGIFESFAVTLRHKFFWSGTSVIDKEKLKKSKFRFPSLVQDYIEKRFEIRAFYFNEKFYSMAIFSQENERTKIDFRNYDLEKPNRMVPFELPEDIIHKLKNFMNLIKLDSGSIDLIVDDKDEYVFLEVNPVGQFGFVSGMCNYNLEKIIAKYLLSNNDEKIN